MIPPRVPAAILASLCLLVGSSAAELLISDDDPLQLPRPGAHQLRVLAPTILELTWITSKLPDLEEPGQWGFADMHARPKLPGAAEFQVLAAGKPDAVTAVGFKRRVIYAPLKRTDLRIGNCLYLRLQSPVQEAARVEVRNPDGQLWPHDAHFTAEANPLRWNPAIHVNQVGYLPAESKQALVGFYMGSLGEMDLNAALGNSQHPSANRFLIVQVPSGQKVFTGSLVPRPDRGFPFECYVQVMEADFSQVRQPGEYRLVVPGLGASYPFRIDDGVAGVFARAYALGLYHQRCGTANELPFTRFVHEPCHVAPAEVPTSSGKFAFVDQVLAEETADAGQDPRHTAPPLKSIAAALYPFVNQGKVDVRGGHHDAGDYSKYTANSASFIHILVFAADNFPGVGDLDNLGIPESGDGKSDVLEEAKWEADFLAKMQDADGGFYFLVYPRNRRYEDDVTPDHGDPQVVFPKTTAVTAAATAALAQCASSPRFKAQFPRAAAEYLRKARLGWAFLQRGIARHGKDGAYQKITHYAADFMHDDELAWASCELFLATGETAFQDQLTQWLDPADPAIRRWGWWRLYGPYGNAIRSYAFAAHSGRLKSSQLLPLYLEQCQAEVADAGQDELRRAQNSAYGTSFPIETKQTRTAGWYFSSDAAFNLAVALQLDYPVLADPRPKLREALLQNLNYEAGCNPVNIPYLTGVGWRRQREIVDQYAQNDRRILPPSGIPIGNIQSGFSWLDRYGKELGELSFPADDDPIAPYPMYDRWSDSFNLSTEFVILNQARGLAYLAWLMAQTPLKNQAWRAAHAQISGIPPESPASHKLTASLAAPGFDLSQAQIAWEARDQEPAFGPSFTFTPIHHGTQWLEAEALLPDGRRLFAVRNFDAK